MVLIFDIDDTLVDHTSAMRAATVKLHASLGPTMPIEKFEAIWRAAHSEQYPRFLKGEASYVETARARVRQVSASHVTDEEADRIFSIYLADYEREWALFDDVLPCLRQLSEMRLAVLSNGRSEEQRRKLSVLGIDGHFPYVCVSEDVGVPKPDPRIFHHVYYDARFATVQSRSDYLQLMKELDARARQFSSKVPPFYVW